MCRINVLWIHISRSSHVDSAWISYLLDLKAWYVDKYVLSLMQDVQVVAVVSIVAVVAVVSVVAVMGQYVCLVGDRRRSSSVSSVSSVSSGSSVSSVSSVSSGSSGSSVSSGSESVSTSCRCNRVIIRAHLVTMNK